MRRAQVTYFFAHQPWGAEVALPIYRSNRFVLSHHLIAIRMMLDAKGLMEADEFDEAVASMAASLPELTPMTRRPAFRFRVLPYLPWTILIDHAPDFATAYDSCVGPAR